MTTAEQKGSASLPVETVTLDSGVRVIAEVDRRGYSAAMGFFVATGSRHETDPESGLSHFLEHMMFKGTARRSAADVNRELDELGGNSNAYTSEEQTVYYASVLPKFQHRMVDLLSDMLTPSLREEDFEVERKVILEEIAKYEDQPPFGAFERSMELRFGPRGLGRRILGTTESITSMTADAMRSYFRRRYTPENVVFAATGNIDVDALIRQLSDATAGWSDRRDAPSPPPDDSATMPAGVDLSPSLTVPDLSQGYHVAVGSGPDSHAADREATAALASVMGDEGGSRLFWELIDTGRAEVATVWPQDFVGDGCFFTYLVGDPDDAESNLRLIDGVRQRLIDDGVDGDELEQVVRRGVASLIMRSERPGNRLFELGSRYLTHSDRRTLDDRIETLRALTTGDLDAAARKYLTSDRVEVSVGPA